MGLRCNYDTKKGILNFITQSKSRKNFKVKKCGRNIKFKKKKIREEKEKTNPEHLLKTQSKPAIVDYIDKFQVSTTTGNA